MVTAGPVAAGSEGSDFISVATISTANWLTVTDDTRWQSEAEANNPCPSGYRLPTHVELVDEALTWSTQNLAGAEASILRLPAKGGYRNFSNGAYYGAGSGHYWTSTVANDVRSRSLIITSSVVNTNSTTVKASANLIRCIKD